VSVEDNAEDPWWAKRKMLLRVQPGLELCVGGDVASSKADLGDSTVDIVGWGRRTSGERKLSGRLG